MASTNMNIRIDEEVKKKAEILFNELGINMTAAINVFLRQSIRENGIPFDVKLESPNALTVAAIKESETLANNKDIKGYSSADNLMRDILSE